MKAAHLFGDRGASWFAGLLLVVVLAAAVLFRFTSYGLRPTEPLPPDAPAAR